LAREVDDCLGIYRALTNLGVTKLCTGEQCEAAELFDEACLFARQVGHTKGIAMSLTNLGWVALAKDDLASATALAKDSLRLCQVLGERETLAGCLEILVVVAVKKGDYASATRLSGASHALWGVLHVNRSPIQYSAATHTEAAILIRRNLAADVFSSNWQEGRALSLDALITFVLDDVTD
jgi:hypothetical protein